MKAPSGFSWVIPAKIAAMSEPSPLRPALEFLKESGISLIVSLTTSPLRKSFLEEFGFEYEHIPIRDFSAPAEIQIDRFVRALTKAIEANGKVVVHCFAGMGRTGTMLACYLVHTGMMAQDAIAEVRKLRPGSIETRSQERAVHDYEKRMRGKAL